MRSHFEATEFNSKERHHRILVSSSSWRQTDSTIEPKRKHACSVVDEEIRSHLNNLRKRSRTNFPCFYNLSRLLVFKIEYVGGASVVEIEVIKM